MSDDEPDLEGPDAGSAVVDDTLTHVAWLGETIDAADAMLERALAYGMYVNKGRALPDVRDGLKPVQRRIVYAMDEIGARAGRSYVKSATVVGHVIGYYHPHGEAGVYDAMVRLAQEFSQNVPLVDGQGNWGSVGPKEFSDPAAAYRYTEARLTEAATDWLSDLREEVVEYRPNFTEKRREPFVLPVSFPNLLVNGAKGIGWSMACEIPPHNLAEACDAAILLAENPEATLDEILAVMPGPDFPTGGIIVDPESLRSAYERGQGTFRLQASFHVEQLPGNAQAVVVNELPFGVSPDQVVSEVVRHARAERISDVTEMPRNLSDRNGLRVQIRCKRGGNVTKLIADLMRQTSMRITVGVNMTVLVDGAPRQIGLRDALDAFVSFRFDVVTRRLQHERATLLRDLHRLVALLAALDAIEKVIRIVRESDDDDQARHALTLELKVRLHGSDRLVPIDDEQAQQILDMPIKRLARLNRLRVEQERHEKGLRVDEIERILDSYDELRDIVVGELRATKRRYGTRRRTRLGGEARATAQPPVPGTGRSREITVVAAPRTDVWLFATAGGTFAARPRDGRLTRAPLIPSANDAVTLVVATDTDSDLNVFTHDGQVYRLRVADIPIEPRASRGVKPVAVGRGQLIAAICPVTSDADYLALVTAHGAIKRVEAAVFAGSHMAGSPALDLAAGDQVVAVAAHAAGDHLLLHSAAGRALRIAADTIRPVKTPTAGGVAGMALRSGDRIVAGSAATGEQAVLVLHQRGNGKLVPLDDYPLKGRGTGGVISTDPDTPRRAPAGPVATAISVSPGTGVIVITSHGSLTRIDTSTVEMMSRSTVSRAMVDVGAGDAVTTAAAG